MNENEIIIVDGIPDQIYRDLINKCVKYSLISLPMTVNRMSIPSEKQRALNIAKGKVAEALFKYFCQQNKINPDFDTCTTPFWTVDKRDFILNGNEWDIKNNFTYHSGTEFAGLNYIDLPALIPNRFNGDQWSKRSIKEFNNSNDVCFLFSFLKSADLINGSRGNEFLEIILSNDQDNFLKQLYSKYKGQLQAQEPFAEDRFWSEMLNRGPDNFFSLHFKPNLIITGFANSLNWNLFRDTGPFDRSNNFQAYLSPRWYLKTNNGSINFMGGTLWTKITNMTTPISSLPSFLSLFPHLRTEIHYGIIKQ